MKLKMDRKNILILIILISTIKTQVIIPDRNLNQTEKEQDENDSENNANDSQNSNNEKGFGKMKRRLTDLIVNIHQKIAEKVPILSTRNASNTINNKSRLAEKTTVSYNSLQNIEFIKNFIPFYENFKQMNHEDKNIILSIFQNNAESSLEKTNLNTAYLNDLENKLKDMIMELKILKKQQSSSTSEINKINDEILEFENFTNEYLNQRYSNLSKPDEPVENIYPQNFKSPFENLKNNVNFVPVD